MLTILKPIILSFTKTQKFKIFVIELLEKLAEQTDNDLDDKILSRVKNGMKLGVV